MTPFQINIPDQSIRDLQDRVRRTRWPGSIFQTGDEDGVSLERVRTLAEQWLDFDWRSAESELNKAPHFVESIDGMDVHFIYQKGVGPFPRPIVLTHGWPSSFLEFRRARCRKNFMSRLVVLAYLVASQACGASLAKPSTRILLPQRFLCMQRIA